MTIHQVHKDPHDPKSTTQRQRRQRIHKEKARLLVAHALRNLTKLPILEENELIDLLDIKGNGKGYWRKANELHERIELASDNVIAALSHDIAFRKHCSLLAAVLKGASIASWAVEQGVSREYVSRTVWKTVTDLVRRELFS